MATMLVRTGEVRIRLSEDDFLTLVEGGEVTLLGDYNIVRGDHSVLRIMLTNDIGPLKMLTLINKVTVAIAERLKGS
jgi:hypothetical protein